MAIYQLKDKSKWTKDGKKWVYDIYYTDQFGKRKEKKGGPYSTKKIAKDKMEEFLLNINKKHFDMKFEVLTELYLKKYKSKNKDTTYYDTKNRIYKHILPYFQKKQVEKINLNDIEIFKENISHLNIRTQNCIITYLKSILRFGIEMYDLNIPIFNKIESVSSGVTPPKTYNIWSIEDFNKFIDIVDILLYKALFTTLYFTGMRIGELLGLTWNDFQNNTLIVNKSYNKKAKLGTPKTNNSYRKVDIPDVVIELLNELYIQSSKVYGFNKNYFIFGDIKPISRSTLLRTKNSYMNKIVQIPNITIHEFRHSHVSLLRMMKYDVRQIANRIGDTEETVIETYSHLFEEEKNKISDGLNILTKSK